MVKSIKFIETKQTKAPTRAKRLAGAKLSALKKVFQNHIVDKKHAAADPKGKQPCHIIGCVVTSDGVTCWYHCV